MSVLPAALLWDMDGTLVDSEGMWLEVETDLAHQLGADLPPGYQEGLVGQSLLYAAEYMLSFSPSTLTPPELVDMMVEGMVRVIRERGVNFCPGVRELFAEAEAAKLPQAIVSMSYRKIIDAVLSKEHLNFEVIVSGDDVERGKPDPMPYLVAAEKLGVDPQHCIAFEDSPAGSTAAVAAGCVTIAIPRELPVSTPGARIVPTLEGVSLSTLRKWCDGADA